ncbi:Z1 domain-containing protein, partial [Acinetobacter baumannii]
EYVTVTKVNSEENVINMLDDTGQLKLRSPLHIFIGGQVLDRGITLTNLIGFYYGRRPNKFQQDTVLQHS